MSIVGYQSTVPIVGGTTNNNTQSALNVLQNHLNIDLIHMEAQNSYAVINETIVIAKNIRLRARTTTTKISGWQVSLPAPLLKSMTRGDYSGLLQSEKGKAFIYSIDNDGRVMLSGTFKDSEDELILNFMPYVAELPLKYVSFPDRQAKGRKANKSSRKK